MAICQEFVPDESICGPWHVWVCLSEGAHFEVSFETDTMTIRRGYWLWGVFPIGLAGAVLGRLC